MVKMKAFLSKTSPWLILVLCLSAMGAELYRPENKNEEEITFSERGHFVIFNHTTSDFDQQERTRAATLRLLEIIKRNPERYRSLVAVDSMALNVQSVGEQGYVRSDDVDHTIASEGGQHRVNLPNADVLIFSGGNMRYCLCESLRDFVRRGARVNENLQVVLVTDAIYDHSNYGGEFYDEGSHTSLERLISDMDDITAESYFIDEVIGQKKLCPEIEETLDGDVPTADYTFVIKRNGRVWRTIGSGPRRVTLNLTLTDEFEGTMNSIEREMAINESDRSQIPDKSRSSVSGGNTAGTPQRVRAE